MILDHIHETIGNTPTVKLNRLGEDLAADIYLKLEWFNPGGSVKDRIALSMIEAAEADGRLAPGDTLIEPTSGNTGIGLAMVAASKGYRLVITMPDTVSTERRQIMKAHGAELVLTDGAKGMKGAIERANILKEAHGYFMPMQFDNPANPKIHARTTAEEILADFTDLDAFVAGVGTGGTITGVGERLKASYQDVEVVAVEPAAAPVLSGGDPGPHKLQGIGAGFIPTILNTDIYDRVLSVDHEDAFRTARRLAEEEGVLAGISTGANVFAALQVARRRGGTVLTISPSNGERYLSTELFDSD